MFSKWYCTDNDCCQYMRSNGTVYEMIQAVWLDRTTKDIEAGLHEYCVVRAKIDINDYSDEEREMYLSVYAFESDEYINDDLTAECILEEESCKDCYVIFDADTLEEAERKIKSIIGE